MFVIINNKNEFYAENNYPLINEDIEFTTDFAKAKIFNNYGGAISASEDCRTKGISVRIEDI